MKSKKRVHPKVKGELHPRNRHSSRYDFDELKKSLPALSAFVVKNKYGDESIEFADPGAVKMLNKALLLHFYDLNFWDIPVGYLCPPIPGRADYIHNMADLLSRSNDKIIPRGSNIKGLDVGIGASCIYPIIGHKEYGWSFIGSDIDEYALRSAKEIVEKNSSLEGHVELRHQKNSKEMYWGVLLKSERIDFSICNPPFHTSAKNAESGTLRKLSNLSHKKITDAKRNFEGQNNELWCEGGEKFFVSRMIRQSKKFAQSCFWFSSLVSDQRHLENIYKELDLMEAVEVKTIPMGQGNKTSRIVAWTYLTPEEQKLWAKERWQQTKPETIDKPATPVEVEDLVAPEKIEKTDTPEVVKESVAPEKVEETIVPEVVKETVVTEKVEETVVPEIKDDVEPKEKTDE